MSPLRHCNIFALMILQAHLSSVGGVRDMRAVAVSGLGPVTASDGRPCPCMLMPCQVHTPVVIVSELLPALCRAGPREFHDSRVQVYSYGIDC